MKSDTERPEVPFEGIIYGEISAWITLVGMVIAIAGLIITLCCGGAVIDEIGLMRDLFGGRTESTIWTDDSVFSGMPQHYWFLKQHLDGDESSMIGLILACYGGVVGVWAMFVSMFRRREVILRNHCFYAVLTVIVGVILTLAATGIIAIR